MNITQRWQLENRVQRCRAFFTSAQIRREIIDLARELAPPDISENEVEAFLEAHGLSGE